MRGRVLGRMWLSLEGVWDVPEGCVPGRQRCGHAGESSTEGEWPFGWARADGRGGPSRTEASLGGHARARRAAIGAVAAGRGPSCCRSCRREVHSRKRACHMHPWGSCSAHHAWRAATWSCMFVSPPAWRVAGPSGTHRGRCGDTLRVHVLHVVQGARVVPLLLLSHTALLVALAGGADLIVMPITTS